MIKIFKGPTGCGKTYQAMTRPGRKKILYGGPCRQLIYETACNYGNCHSNVLTSDICIGDCHKYNKSFRTYECITREDVRKCDVLVIDEAHFMSSADRGPHIKDLITFADKIRKEVILLSATMDFTVPKAKVINLPARGERFIREAVSYSEGIARMQAGVPTLVFHARRDECGMLGREYGLKTGVITANTSVADRIKIVDSYKRGDITLIEATNAMAQGVNVPCENLINFFNSWDDPACIVQKMGRLGRTGVTREGVRLTYFLDYSQEEIDGFKAQFERPEKDKARIELKAAKSTAVEDYDLRNPATAEEKKQLENKIIKHWEKHNV